MLSTRILDGISLQNARIDKVIGGDINETYKISKNNRNYFIKVNDAERYPEMLVKEAEGLNYLGKNSKFHIPKVEKTGVIGNQQYILMEFLESDEFNRNSWNLLGRNMAEMHSQRISEKYGWSSNNYIGSLIQRNDWSSRWEDFYFVYRLLPLLNRLLEKGSISINEIALFESFCKKLPSLIPIEHPSLLHGDLWSGNKMALKNGDVSIFDPAIYFGHREMDIAMTQLFGGFEMSFYSAYNETYPLEKGWEMRIPSFQLYPLLVHAVLFGDSYWIRALGVVKDFN
jgi:fructosamine-3-kinase